MAQEPEKISGVIAIKRFFEQKDIITPDGGKKFGFDELKAIPKTDRDELGVLCAVELGVEIKLSQGLY